MSNKPLILKSPVTERYYFVRAYNTTNTGHILVTGKKEDVTEQINSILKPYGNELDIADKLYAHLSGKDTHFDSDADAIDWFMKEYNK